jgi:hypothetical protein
MGMEYGVSKSRIIMAKWWLSKRGVFQRCCSVSNRLKNTNSMIIRITGREDGREGEREGGKGKYEEISLPQPAWFACSWQIVHIGFHVLGCCSSCSLINGLTCCRGGNKSKQGQGETRLKEGRRWVRRG